MSVIIRLQNLPWSANAFDIRQYFHGLSIPEGGVHIVGGELGDAFIAFSTDEDARQAMLTDGGKIKEVKIKLYLSSRSEMQKVIETARAQSLQPYLQIQATQIPATTIQPQAATLQPQAVTLQPQAATIPPQASSIQPPVATIQPQVATIQPHVPATVTQIQSTVTQIPPTPTQSVPAMPPLTQIPIPEKPIEAKDPPLPPFPPTVPPAESSITSEPATTIVEHEKKDQDTESLTSKDNKRSRKGRSRSRSKNRSNSRDRSKSRDRSRSRDRSHRSRYKDRRRRDRSHSRDRRSKRRNRDRSRSRDRSRRYSRDRKRDSDRGDRNSTENSNDTKIAAVPENSSESSLLATPTTSTKPGFSSTGWISVGSADKPGPLLQKPIGFSIAKQPNAPGPQSQNQIAQSNIQPQIVQTNPQMQINPQIPQNNINQQLPRSNIHPQAPPLPPQVQLPPPQIPTSTQLHTTSTQPMMLPHPPPFPAMPLDPSGFPKSNDQNMPFMPLGFPQGPPHMPTLQQNVFLAPNHSQFPQKVPTRPINPNQFQMWPTMRPPIDSPMLSAPGMLNIPQNPGNVNAVFNRPPIMPHPSEKFHQPYVQPDPRLQSGVNTQQIPDHTFAQNTHHNSNIHNQANFPARVFGNPNESSFSSCVEIRNMPMNTTSGDIVRFFQGLHISRDGVKIITDKKGNKVGIAYVKFVQSYFKDMALKRSGQMLKNSNVEVLHIDNVIFDKATDFSVYADGNYYQEQNQKDFQQESYDDFMGEDDNSEVFTDLVIHEVPPNAIDKDIYNLFKGFKILDAFVLSGTKTNTGFIRFRTAEEARRALANSSRLLIGYTHVKVAICYENEFAEARDRKNMEENDEEMMDSKDTIYDHETRDSHESKRYPSHSYAQDRSDARHSQAGKRGLSSKALLPTPPSRSFDPSVDHGNPNFPQRLDRRHQEKHPRGTRENFHDRTYGNEDSRSRFSSENSRFQPRPHTREGYPNKNTSKGDFHKRPLDELYGTPKETREDLPAPAKLVPSSEQPGKLPVNPHKVLKNSTEKRIEGTRDQINEEESKCININDKPELSKDQTFNSKENPSTAIKPPIDKLRNKREHQLGINDALPPRENLEFEASVVMEQTSQDSVSTDCLILQGLPFTATDRDILDFFSDVGLAPTKIHIMLDKNGQPAGDAFCEFNAPEEVSRALTKNRNLMGRSSVSVLAVDREEMMETLGAVNPLPDMSHQEPEESYRPPTGTHRPGNRFPMPSQPYPHFPHRGRGRGAFRGPSRHPHPAPPETEMTSQNVKAFGKPGCVVAVENVPFRAEVDDIIGFFKDFFVPRDNVIRRFDELGRATGDARVSFNSPVEAQRAVRALSGRRIFNREIYLSLVP